MGYLSEMKIHLLILLSLGFLLHILGLRFLHCETRINFDKLGRCPDYLKKSLLAKDSLVTRQK